MCNFSYLTFRFRCLLGESWFTGMRLIDYCIFHSTLPVAHLICFLSLTVYFLLVQFFPQGPKGDRVRKKYSFNEPSFVQPRS